MAEEQLVLFSLGNEEYAISITQVKEIVHIAPLPATTEKRYLRGIGKEEKRLLILLDVDELFSEEEMKELKKVG